VAAEGSGGFARTYTFWMDDRAIAGALGLAHRGSLLVILGGFDEAGYRKQSIGSLMFRTDRPRLHRARRPFARFHDWGRTLQGYLRRPAVADVADNSGPAARSAMPPHMTVEKLPAAKALARRLVGSHGKKPKPLSGSI